MKVPSRTSRASVRLTPSLQDPKTSPRTDCPWFISLDPPLSAGLGGPPADASFYDAKNSCRSSQKLSDSKDTDKASHPCAD